MSEEDTDLNRLKGACDMLSEHFDCVQIFASRYNPEGEGQNTGTVNCAFGAGNIFGRIGHIKAWIVRQDEIERQQVKDV